MYKVRFNSDYDEFERIFTDYRSAYEWCMSKSGGIEHILNDYNEKRVGDEDLLPEILDMCATMFDEGSVSYMAKDSDNPEQYSEFEVAYIEPVEVEGQDLYDIDKIYEFVKKYGNEKLLSVLKSAEKYHLEYEVLGSTIYGMDIDEAFMDWVK